MACASHLAVHLALILFALPTSAKDCKAADPGLNLTKAGAFEYYAADDRQLQRICECTTMDYVSIGSGYGCPTCAQETLDACRLESISGKDPFYGYSLYISNCTLITSLRGLARLSGALPESLYVGYIDKLTTLDGLGNIASIGKNKYRPAGTYGISIFVDSNPEVVLATSN